MLVSHMEAILLVPGHAIEPVVRVFDFLLTIEFALEIRRPDGMNNTAVDMAVFSVTVIPVGMHVEERNREHPHPNPHQHHQAEWTGPRCFASHHEPTVSPLRIQGQSLFRYSSTLRNRSAFEMTDTELKVIAALANIGLSSMPMKGYKTPAASGTPITL